MSSLKKKAANLYASVQFSSLNFHDAFEKEKSSNSSPNNRVYWG